jgi:hypothetical protein
MDMVIVIGREALADYERIKLNSKPLRFWGRHVNILDRADTPDSRNAAASISTFVGAPGVQAVPKGA